MRKRDPLGYYAALRVGRDATHEEIRLAYMFLKQGYKESRQALNIQEIRAAYRILGNTKTRKCYDRGEFRGAGLQLPSSAAVRPYLNSVGVMAVLFVVFVAVLAFLFGPAVRSGLTEFAPGDELVWRHDGRPLGTVLAYEREHPFPNDRKAAAYQIRTAENESTVWYPARDLNRHCERRSR